MSELRALKCPSCGNRAAKSISYFFSEQEDHACQSCGARIEHSTLHFLASLLVCCAVSILVVLQFRGSPDWLIYLIGLAGLAAICISFFVFVPLVVKKPEKVVSPQSGSISIWQSPLIWLGLPVLIFILIGLVR